MHPNLPKTGGTVLQRNSVTENVTSVHAALYVKFWLNLKNTSFEDLRQKAKPILLPFETYL